MFAVIKAGGKQYRVAAEDVIRIDRVEKQPGEVVSFGEVLVVGGDTPSIGAPTVSGATVAGEVSRMSAATRSSPSRSAAARIHAASAAIAMNSR